MEDRESGHGSGRATGIIASTVSFLGLLAIAAITSGSAIYWGGVYTHAAPWFWAGGCLLWLLLAAGSAITILERRRCGDWIDAAAILFLIYAAWSYSTSPARYVAREEMLWILTYAATFWFMRYAVVSRHAVFWLITTLALTASGVCLFALITKGNPTHDIWGLPRPDYGARISGTFGCPNHFANFMAMSVMSCLFLGTYSRIVWPVRIFFFYLAAMLTVGLFFSISRGGYLAWGSGMFVVGLCVLANPKVPWKLKLAGIVAVCCVAAAFVFFVVRNDLTRDRVQQAIDGNDIRLELAQVSLKIWEGSRLCGTGMATYDNEFLRAHDVGLQSRAIYAHNDYLNTLADYGILGFAPILAFLILTAVLLARRSLHPPHERERLLTRLGWTILTLMAVHSVFDFSLHIPACALMFFTLIGAGTMHSRREQRHGNRWLSLSPALLLAGASVPLIMGPLAWKTHLAIKLLDKEEADFSTMSMSEIDRLAEEAWDIDSSAGPLYEKTGDALRVIAAGQNAALKKMAKGSDEWRATIRERETAGQLALKYYERAHQSNTLADDLVVKQAMTYDVLQRYPEAYMLYNQALAYQPYNRFFIFALGYHFAQEGQIDAAISTLEKARDIPIGTREEPEVRDRANTVLEALKILRERLRSQP